MALVGLASDAAAQQPFAIHVIDAETRRGVPLVELETTHHVKLVTDSAGVAAFREPGLMGQRVFFTVRSHGYEFAADGFGFHGRPLAVEPGGSATLEVRRINLAERLYRVTGAGIYRDSLLVGRAVPPGGDELLPAKAVGMDSVLAAEFRGRLYWFWGDTHRPRYPLGNFHMTGATSELPSAGGLSPAVGVRLRYFVGDEGFARGMAPLPGEGATWLSGLVVLREATTGDERMFAHYVKMRKGASIQARGLAEYDAEAEAFVHLASFPVESRFADGAHTFLHTVGGREYVYYCDPFPLLRVPADAASLADPALYEAYTCVAVGEPAPQALPPGGDADASAPYSWRRAGEPLRPDQETKLVASGLLDQKDLVTGVRDVETGRPVVLHRGSTYWNAYRGRWILIANEVGGESSFLGEVWYAEADHPLGPWLYARKIATHDKYSFYNPTQHPYFDEDGGRTIYFEGTYASTFSHAKEKTPRYEYNQILYRLDLTVVRLPVPVYQLGGVPGGVPGSFQVGRLSNDGPRSVAFWALDRPWPEAVAVYETRTKQGMAALTVAGEPDASPLFWGLAPDHASPPADSALLYEYRAGDGRRGYAVSPEHPTLSDWERAPEPLVRVWRHTLRRVPHAE